MRMFLFVTTMKYCKWSAVIFLFVTTMKYCKWSAVIFQEIWNIELLIYLFLAIIAIIDVSG